MSRSDWGALALSIAAVIASYLVAGRVFENIPHLEDEIAYVWQAETIARGDLTIPTPVEPKRFLIPFVVDYQGQRFGKYPPGWPAVLSIGVRLGLREWVNPLLAGFAVWLTYRLGKKLRDETAGLLAALLTTVSPFFLMNTGSLLSHALGLVLSLAFVLSWWDMLEKKDTPGGRLPAITGGLVLGTFAISRPFTALGVALPFGIYGLILLVRGPKALRKRVLVLGALAGAVSGLHFLWQAAVTGDPFLNPYTLWWPYDKVGFGPGVGVTEQGHTLRTAWINTRFSLTVAAHDLFGWPWLSWLFVPFGLWAARHDKRTLVTSSVFFSLLGIYLAYWIGAWIFGPRYQFEGLYSLTLLTALGIQWLAGWGQDKKTRQRKVRRLAVTSLVLVLIFLNLRFYLPMRMDTLNGLYGISARQLAPFKAAGHLAPAAVIVHADIWMEYGGLLELQDPYLTSPFIFTFGDKAGLTETIQEYFPTRAIYHYYPDEPGKFYTAPR